MTDFPENIMHIDDSELEHILVESAFDSMPQICVKSYGSGEAAIAALEAEQPQLILLDLKMPGMDGPEVLQKIRENSKAQDIPVIFLTGAEKMVMTKEYELLKVIGIIHKPVKPDMLVESITKLWREKNS